MWNNWRKKSYKRSGDVEESSYDTTHERRDEEMNPYEVAWKSLQAVIMAKKEWDTRDLINSITYIEAQFEIGVPADLARAMSGEGK